MRQEETSRASKVAVVGCGAVGTTFAYAALIRGLASRLALIDVELSKAEGHAMDLRHALPFLDPAEVEVGGMERAEGADLVVIAAGAAQQPGETRLALAERNVALIREIVPQLATLAPQAILLITSNPVDVLTLAALKYSGFPPARVFGSGTVLDTMRLRSVIARHCRINPRNVHAYVIGEHGDSEVVAWSTATAAGVPALKCIERVDPTAAESLGAAITQEVKGAAYEIIARKRYTNFAIGIGLAVVAQAVLRDERSVFTVSRLLEGQQGVSGICLSLPCIVARGGAVEIVDIQLSQEEREAFERSATTVGEVAREQGLLGS